MHEIEIKAALKDKEGVMERLRALGCVFSDPVTQEDVVYVERIGSVETYYSNKAFLRLRVNGKGETLFTLKYHLTARADNPTSSPMEHELQVSSREEMEKILLALVYKEAVRLRKSRIKSSYNNWTICIDEVETLGTFVEIEELGNEEDAPRIHEEMLAFLGSLSISKDDMSSQRYDILLLEKAAHQG